MRKSRAGESFYLRVYGKLNHNIRCTLRGYRNLMGDFTGNTIYTGYHSPPTTACMPPCHALAEAGRARMRDVADVCCGRQDSRIGGVIKVVWEYESELASRLGVTCVVYPWCRWVYGDG